MSHIGWSEILVIFAIAVVVFGYKKLPDLGKNLGRGIKNFKRSLEEPDEIDITPPAKPDAKNEPPEKSKKE